MLFLVKFEDVNSYAVTGVWSGKFKLEGDKVRGFGEDPVRQEAEKFTKKSFHDKVETVAAPTPF